MTFNVLRMPQNKAIHCYLLMSVWILLLIVGIYKFLEPNQKLVETPTIPTELFNSLSVDVKTKRIFKICNFPNEITAGNEGILETNKWVLKGLLILIRHGDRGPLQHVRKISSINCGAENMELLTSYKSFNIGLFSKNMATSSPGDANLIAETHFSIIKEFLHNQTLSNKVSWIGPGPFHGFPFLPTHPRHCQLGQLTMQGITQLLKLGDLLKRSYHKVWPKLKVLGPHELMVYSTRYRRTFQSGLAFLFGLIPHDTLSRINIHESQSMSFCFKDCGCPVTEKLSKYVRRNMSHQLKSHPAVASLADRTGRLLFSPSAEQGYLGSDPHAVRDALLSFVCHGNGLPCETPLNCIKRQNVAGIFAYTDWVNYQKWRNIFWRRYCLLKSYGLIRHIVQQMLHMVSSNGPYLVLYSGHDHTLEQLATALGLLNDPFLLRYAARIIFEVYQDNRESNDAKGVYFRLLSNGRDITKNISFCKNFISVDPKINLCKIEDIVRFLHDDYFSSLNVSNYKDACLYKND